MNKTEPNKIVRRTDVSASKAKKAKVAMMKKFVTKIGTPEKYEHEISVKKNSSNTERKKNTSYNME